MKFKIDHREQSLKEIFIKNNIENIEFSNLEHGDFIIENNDDEPMLIIERKTLSDLVSSLKDGRYRNQKIELMNKFNRSTIYYIIEGKFDYSDANINFNGLDKKTIIGSVLNTMIRDDIKVFITANIEDTYNLLINIYNRVSKDPEKYMKIEAAKVKFVKKSTNINVFHNMLCQIPGVSNKVAGLITDKYSTLMIFYNAFKDKDEKEKLKLFKDITLDTNNKAFSKTTVSLIIKHLLE
jgi:ERCC4-type nuclease